VKNGDKVSQGQVVGLTGGGLNDFGRGNSQGPHLHFTLKKDGQKVDPIQYMGKFDLGNQKLSDIKPSTDNATDDTTTSGTTTPSLEDKDDIFGTLEDKDDIFGTKKLDPNDPDDARYLEMGQQLGKSFGLTEEKINLGYKTINKSNSIIIPSSDNSKIKSPYSGYINNRSDKSCNNQITIEHEIGGKTYYLQYCGISNPEIRNGNKVSKGDILGRTSSNVTVSLYDKSWNKLNISKEISKNLSDNKSKRKDITNNKNGIEYIDPLYPWLGEKIKKIIPSNKNPMSKITNFFNKYGMTNKKVNENIERIKTLLK
jgi:biotin carboxyl carrier protein